MAASSYPKDQGAPPVTHSARHQVKTSLHNIIPANNTMRGIRDKIMFATACIAVIRITFTTEENNNCQVSTCAEDQVLLSVGKHGKAQCVDCTFQLQTHWLLRTSLQ